MCFPAQQSGLSPIGERVDAALDPHEPAIDIPLKDFRGIGQGGFQVPRPRWRLRQGSSASQGLLAICRHDWLPGTAAGGGITLAPPMLVDNLGTALGVPSRSPGCGLDDDLHLACSGHGKKAEAEEAAKLLDARVAFPATAASGSADRQPDLITDGGSVDRLQHQVKGEGEFELAYDDSSWCALLQGDQITTADLTLDLEAELFEEALDRQVKG